MSEGINDEKYETPKKKMLKETENTPRRSARRSILKKREPEVELHAKTSDEENNSEIENDEPMISKAIFKEHLDGLGVEGKTVFGFHTPKKKDGMSMIAANVCTTPKTPKYAKTPDAKSSKNVPKTPKNVRNNVKKGISKLKCIHRII